MAGAHSASHRPLCPFWAVRWLWALEMLLWAEQTQTPALQDDGLRGRAWAI